MSAPHTNIEKQKRRHIVPIVAMIAILIVVIIGFVWWLGDETNDPEMPGQQGGPVEEMTQTPSAEPTGTAQPAE